jgi:hypothetical protein
MRTYTRLKQFGASCTTLFHRAAFCVTFLFDGANKTKFGQIVFGHGKMQIMQSGKPTKKTKKSAIESHASSEGIDALETPNTSKRASKPLATSPPPVKDATIAKPKSFNAQSRATSSERPTRSTALHRAAKPATVAAEVTREVAPATVAEDVKAVASSTAPHRIAHHDVAKLAYSYWLARGRQGGSSYDDWIRAEHELRSNR